MTGETCDRFEREGLRQLQEGGPLDSHFDTCPDCLRARDEYQRLVEDLSGLGTGEEPPPQWQARTWARIERRSAARRRRGRWLFWLAPAATVAAAVVVLLLRPPAAVSPLEVTVEHGATTSRGATARPGDRMILRAAAGDAAFAELRVYRDDAELVLRCSTEEPCRRRGDTLEAAFVLPAVGSYQPLLLLAEVPVPPPTSGGLDDDADAALAAGVRVELGDEVHVE